MNLRILAPVVMIGLILLSTQVFSGGLNPASPPDSSNGYTLEDIWNRIQNASPGSISPFIEPPAGPDEGTGRTLDGIMSIAPEQENTNAADPTHVISGKTYWSLVGGAWGPQVGAAIFPAYSPKTGQTSSYATGDDGELEKGVAWPNPRFIDNSDGTITDNLTGLIWLRDANCFGLRTWTEALDDCNRLDMGGGSCGLSDGSTAGDWRLPSYGELMSLIHYGFGNPAVPNTAGTGKWESNDPFINVQTPNFSSSLYWSSTTTVSNTSWAWRVSMYNGAVGYNYKTITSYVWPVRSGQ